MRNVIILKNYNKYSAKKTLCSYGHIHDSTKEANRCDKLHMLQRAGQISNLEIQKSYTLIPAIYETKTLDSVYKTGAKKGQPKTEKVCTEKAVTYKADFVYYDKGRGVTVIEDCKGVQTKEYILKRKLMKHLYCQNSNTIFIET